MNNTGRVIVNHYCNGFFGRRYDLSGSTIEAEGYDWIVIRLEDGGVAFADVKNSDKQSLIEKWCNED